MHPVLFRIGNFEVPSFGVMMVLAFLAGMWIATVRAQRYGITKQQIQDASFWALLAGILGARIVFIVQEIPYYLEHPDQLLTLRFQGLTSFGGLIFGALAVMVWCRRNRVPVLNMLDVAAPGFLIGHVIGRFGCLLNGCCFGSACPPDTPWAITVSGSPYLHHPAQVYDALMNAVVLGLLLLLERRNALRLGEMTGLTLALHGLTRFIYEFWRAGTVEEVRKNVASSTYWGSLPITQAQAMALVLVLVGFGVTVYYHRRKRETVEGASE
ncbi:MAG TPA: prolipoprotein diacylglyceryl transferase [Fimbriimonas sp.]